MGDKPWVEAFDFYLSHMQEHPLAVSLDLGAAPHAPAGGHPVLLRARIRMRTPRGDGLQSEHEVDALGSLEERVLDTIAACADVLYVGRVVVNGLCDLVMYGAPGTLEALEAIATAVEAVRGDYQIEVSAEPDAEWNFYRDFLSPNPYEYQLMTNRRLLQVFRERGDTLERERTLDHLALFYRRKRAEQAAAKLTDAGFDVDEPRKDSKPGEPPEWSVSFRAASSLEPSRLDSLVIDVLDIVLPLEGRYDGWGAPLVFADEN